MSLPAHVTVRRRKQNRDALVRTLTLTYLRPPRRQAATSPIQNPEAVNSRTAEFLARPRTMMPCCLVLDVSLPDLNGLELQKLIASERTDMPIIFITGHGDVPMTVQAMKAGAVEFLTKPFDDEVLLTAIRQALERSAAVLDDEAELMML